MTMITVTTVPPKYIRSAMKNALMNAMAAVMNHPPMTDSTPVILNTALSLLQALSARDVPIATMNVTYVVERGSLRDVPRAIRREATTRFTDALTTS